MTQELFRQEAVEHSTQRLYGRVVVVPSISHTVIFVALLLCIGLFAAALIKGVYTEKHTVTGILQIRAQRGTGELYLPKKMMGLLQPNQHLAIRLAGVARSDVGDIDAQIVEIGTNAVLIQSGSIQLGLAQSEMGQSQLTQSHSGDASDTVSLLCVPVSVVVSEASLRAAGMPLGDHLALAIRSDVVVAKKSWLRWVIGSITPGDLGA